MNIIKGCFSLFFSTYGELLEGGIFNFNYSFINDAYVLHIKK